MTDIQKVKFIEIDSDDLDWDEEDIVRRTEKIAKCYALLYQMDCKREEEESKALRKIRTQTHKVSTESGFIWYLNGKRIMNQCQNWNNSFGFVTFTTDDKKIYEMVVDYVNKFILGCFYTSDHREHEYKHVYNTDAS